MPAEQPSSLTPESPTALLGGKREHETFLRGPIDEANSQLHTGYTGYECLRQSKAIKETRTCSPSLAFARRQYVP